MNRIGERWRARKVADLTPQRSAVPLLSITPSRARMPSRKKCYHEDDCVDLSYPRLGMGARWNHQHTD